MNRAKVLALHADGVRNSEIAKETNLSPARVSQIISREKEIVAEPEAAAPMPPDVLMALVWGLTQQEREQIHYGIAEMGNPPDEVGACFDVNAEVALKVVEVVSRKDHP